MNIRQELEKGSSKAQINRVVQQIGDDPEQFRRLVEILDSETAKTSQRASWVLTYCVEKYPELLKPHLKSLLTILKKPNIHGSLKRNIVRAFQFIDIPKKFQGEVATLCFDFLQDKKEAVAVRVFSMTVLDHLARKNPELKNELHMIVEDNLPWGSPGFRARAKRILQDEPR